jgi:phosphoribosylamine---glycine ligase
MRVLLIGSGGREHALAWRLASSDSCKALYCAPGNPGIAQMAECVPIAVDDIKSLTDFAVQMTIDLVVVGPEIPLVAGIADSMRAQGIAVFGPSQAAAQLEGSKGFTKDLCKEFGIPTAAYGRFNELEKAKSFIKQTGAPIVVKADGLAAGKGVVICQSEDEAMSAVSQMLSGDRFGQSGAEIVIEEFLDGEELSFFALSDGQTVLPFNSAQDHKRVGEGDTGPNTGGMGAYSPAHILTLDLQQKIMERIIIPTVKGMEARGMPFQGVLFAGIMVVKGEPFLIEYNVRFGDPECQAMMLRFQNDVLDVLYACATGTLKKFEGGMRWSSHVGFCVVMAAKGYPDAYSKGGRIQGLDDADQHPGTKVFHAGTALNEKGELIAQGGRVLNICTSAGSVKESQEKALTAIADINWADGFYRRDIGWRAIKAESDKQKK